MSPHQATLDQAKVNEFLGKAIQDVAATFHAGLVLIGDKLGLYRALADGGPMTAAELAKRTGARKRRWRRGQRNEPPGSLHGGRHLLHAMRT